MERKQLTARVECGASIHAIFQLTVRQIQMFFSLKPSQSQGESSLKISARWENKQTNKQTHSLTDWRFYRVIVQIQRLFRKLEYKTDSLLHYYTFVFFFQITARGR